jgi:hypothetical protein
VCAWSGMVVVCQGLYGAWPFMGVGKRSKRNHQLGEIVGRIRAGQRAVDVARSMRVHVNTVYYALKRRHETLSDRNRRPPPRKPKLSGKAKAMTTRFLRSKSAGSIRKTRDKLWGVRTLKCRSVRYGA